MMGLIQGVVCYLNAPLACVMTASGVGYEIELPIPSFCQLSLNEQTQIYTHLYVREDAQLLYGFIQKQDRDVFRKLIKINGVGAKMALAMLSTLSASELKQAVEQEDDLALVRVPGIGKKTAQRLIIELKGKLVEFGGVAEFGGRGEFFDDNVVEYNQMHIIAEVESALIGLGYKEKEAQHAIKQAQLGLETIDTSSLLKATLKQLAS
ncbi:Holliday junction branch migration protein RuvA [Moraxella sp. ZY200743]|uniref:Holliday junction branch migration protein RuvA n=1 Tax=Moraxella sp. ZY200743 TaxID=2911970 RepID=UPI003D7D2715